VSPATAAARRACVFAHYDERGEFADYARYYLEALQEHVSQLVVVSTAPLQSAAREYLEQRGVQLIVRPNEGYDFYSYRVGIATLDLVGLDELVICNDSVYGPFRPLEELFQRAAADPADLVGLTASTEIDFHLQSYFLLFRSPLLASDDFQEFWDQLEPLEEKRRIIEQQEVGLTQFFLSRNHRVSALYERRGDSSRRVVSSLGYYLDALRRRWWQRAFWGNVFQMVFRGRRAGVNPTHADWRYLLQELGFPFIKIELLRDNPKQLRNIEEWPAVVASLGDYPVTLAQQHLARLRAAKEG
jgi:lipopolysaccharide biosynthesis protein